ncbi:DMT family transporter [Flammeovirga sp. SubArs3]|uniref:DMT family transporter n=1 Tax=Flammeovirga sp. SubArs3 TaxID=2995316 RepID=UPI00248AE4FB|nr:DMT family transporter [Flammeovirga sp. SubArs3]
MNSTNKGKYYFFLIFTTFVWGINFHISQVALKYTSPMVTGTYRYFLGAICLIGFAFIKKPSKEDVSRAISNWKSIIFLGVIGAFLYNVLFLEGIKSTSAFNGVLIIGLTPLNTALISIPMLGTRLKRKEMISILFGFIGILLVISKGDINTIRSFSFSKGDLYILAANISFSFANVYIKKYLNNISPLWLTNLVTIVACICFMIYTLSFETISFPTSQEYLWSILFMGVLSTAIAGAFWIISIKEMGAETSTLFMNLVPVFGTSASFILGEEIVGAQIFGGLFVITGLLINSIKIKRKKSTAQSVSTF